MIFGYTKAPNKNYCVSRIFSAGFFFHQARYGFVVLFFRILFFGEEISKVILPENSRMSTECPLKTDGWKTIRLPFLGPIYYFQG